MVVVCVLQRRGRSENSNLNAVVVIQIIVVVVMVNWTVMIIDRGSEDNGQIQLGGRRSHTCWFTEHLM